MRTVTCTVPVANGRNQSNRPLQFRAFEFYLFVNLCTNLPLENLASVSTEQRLLSKHHVLGQRDLTSELQCEGCENQLTHLELREQLLGNHNLYQFLSTDGGAWSDKDLKSDFFSEPVRALSYLVLKP